jgi:hypothetical protein
MIEPAEGKYTSRRAKYRWEDVKRLDDMAFFRKVEKTPAYYALRKRYLNPGPPVPSRLTPEVFAVIDKHVRQLVVRSSDAEDLRQFIWMRFLSVNILKKYAKSHPEGMNYFPNYVKLAIYRTVINYRRDQARSQHSLLCGPLTKASDVWVRQMNARSELVSKKVQQLIRESQFTHDFEVLSGVSCLP